MLQAVHAVGVGVGGADGALVGAADGDGLAVGVAVDGEHVVQSAGHKNVAERDK